jgi:hypothetical protein
MPWLVCSFDLVDGSDVGMMECRGGFDFALIEAGLAPSLAAEEFRGGGIEGSYQGIAFSDAESSKSNAPSGAELLRRRGAV